MESHSGYSAQLGFEIGAHALRATAATNALDHQADIAKVAQSPHRPENGQLGLPVAAEPKVRFSPFEPPGGWQKLADSGMAGFGVIRGKPAIFLPKEATRFVLDGRGDGLDIGFLGLVISEL